jgi:hypothetical protein
VIQKFEASDYQAPSLINGDNQGVLALLKHLDAHQRTKHLDVAFHFPWNRVERGEVVFQHSQTDSMVADCLTKAEPIQKVENNKKSMNLPRSILRYLKEEECWNS